MADSEQSKAEGGGSAPAGKRREELDQLLQRIAAHIADADKTASTDRALRPSLRQPQPPAAAASEPAGKGVKRDLARTLRADAGGAAVTAGPAAAMPQEKTEDETNALSPPSMPARRTPSAVEPPALRSAVARQKAVATASPDTPLTAPRASEPTEPSKPPAEETPAAVPSTEPPAVAAAPRPAGDEPWDSDAAEALTRTYEADAALPPLRSMLSAMAIEPGQSSQSDTADEQEVADRATTRLIEAARRVEAMLDALAPRDAVDALGARFDRLADTVERTTGELHRLDGIETRLGELGNKLSDDQIVALFGPLVPTAEDLSRFADDAAGRAADRMLEAYAHQMSAAAPAKTGDAVSSSQLKALGELLGNFMDDRRRSDAETQDALETLQLAMQHLLDRVDQIEPAAPVEPRGEPVSLVEEHLAQKARMTSAAAPLMEPEVDDYDAPEHRPAAAPQQPRHDLVAPPRHQPAFAADALDTMPDARGYSEAEPVRESRRALPTASAFDAEMPQHLPEPLPGMAGQQPGSPHETASAHEAPPVSDRQAFIAMARKAAEKAKATADAQAPASAGKAAAPRTPRAAVTGAAVTGAKAAGKAVGGVRPGVLIVAAVAVVLLAGYWFIAGPRLNLLSRETLPEATEQVDAPASQPRSGAQPDIESDDALKPGRSGERPAAPRRTSDEMPAAPQADSLQEARLDTSPSQAAGPGMAVTLGEQPATAEQVLQARERNRIAALSQRTSFAAARLHPVPPGASPVETASIPSEPATQPQAAAPATPSRQLTLPPAATGPLSLRLAAAQGDPSAQLEIATRLAEGKGVKQSFAEAAQWYERAAAQGEGVAQYRLGTLYERGMGVKADRETARGWYQKAADQGNLKAMHNLAVMGASPTAGTPDYATAASLFSKAASHGLADSQYNLGVLYESGLGVPKDHAAAYKWYTLAARGGDQDAARRRDLLISRLPAETLQTTDAQIATWRPMTPIEQANNANFAGQSWKQRAADARR